MVSSKYLELDSLIITPRPEAGGESETKENVTKGNQGTRKERAIIQASGSTLATIKGATQRGVVA